MNLAMVWRQKMMHNKGVEKNGEVSLHDYNVLDI